MSTCLVCGTRRNDDDRYCVDCGNGLEIASALANLAPAAFLGASVGVIGVLLGILFTESIGSIYYTSLFGFLSGWCAVSMIKNKDYRIAIGLGICVCIALGLSLFMAHSFGENLFSNIQLLITLAVAFLGSMLAVLAGPTLSRWTKMGALLSLLSSVPLGEYLGITLFCIILGFISFFVVEILYSTIGPSTTDLLILVAVIVTVAVTFDKMGWIKKRVDEKSS